MPVVETKVTINAPLEHVYSIAQDNSAFPEFMEDVESLVVIDQKDGRVVSDWVGIIPGFGLKIKWQQEDVWEDATHRCVFRQLSGGYDRMDGEWHFYKEGDVTVFESVLNYEYNVPAVGPLINKVIFNVVQKNMKNMLEAIKQRAESTHQSL